MGSNPVTPLLVFLPVPAMDGRAYVSLQQSSRASSALARAARRQQHLCTALGLSVLVPLPNYNPAQRRLDIDNNYREPKPRHRTTHDPTSHFGNTRHTTTDSRISLTSGKRHSRQGIADRYRLTPSLHQNSTDAQDGKNNGSQDAGYHGDDRQCKNLRVSPPGSGDSPFIYLRTRAAARLCMWVRFQAGRHGGVGRQCFKRLLGLVKCRGLVFGFRTGEGGVVAGGIGGVAWGW